ncbi:MAG: hypothetical protein KC505_04740, partial [Myxococcales bacterium]|nr:hypothetical protein [Myxococcales bacterium]
MRFLSTYLCIIVLFSKLSFSLDSINQRGEDIGQMIPVFSTLAPMGSTALFITGAGGVVAGAATTSATISGISTSACAIGAVNYNGGNAPIIGNVYVFLEGQEANCKSDIARGVIKFWKRFFLSPKTDDEWKSFKTTV